MTSHIKALGALLVISLLIVGCGDEKTVVVEPEMAIKVSVQATPDSVDSGGRITAIAMIDTDRTGLTLAWQSAGGRFSSADAETTTWFAPDDPGLYTLSVVVNDGSDVAIGTAMVGVATYVPTDLPAYVGASSCAICHNGGDGGDQYESWSNTAHAHAMETLRAIGTQDNARCQSCHTVGTYGLGADPDKNNGGYNETQVARLEGVQCENCHGPGSAHPSEPGMIQTSIEAEVCGSCHTDEHHPTYDEWLESGHSGFEERPAGRASCAKCHNGHVAVAYLDDPVGFVNPSEDPTEMIGHTCAVCHDPHGNDNPGSLRDASVTDVVLPNAILVERAGAGRLCMSCHNGRRTEEDVDDQIENGSGHFGPHHSIQGDMLAGVNAYERVNEDFDFASSKHILVEDACVTCHTSPQEGDLGGGVPNFTGHTFEPTVAACTPCHGEIDDFADIGAKEDYDGNGLIEGVQVEVGGLLDRLQMTIINVTEADSSRAALEKDFEGELGNTDHTTVEQRKAGYNWAFVDFDHSHGVHNAAYSIQLLQQSILFLDPGGLPASAYRLEEVE